MKTLSWMSGAILSALLLMCAVAGAKPLSVEVRLLQETRSTEPALEELIVNLKVVGDLLSGTRAVHARIDKASSGGRNLIDREKYDPGFEAITPGVGMRYDLRVYLRAPARTAKKIEEISGELELFTPKNDEAATITREVSKILGAPLEAEGLKAAGLKVLVWDKARFETYQAASKEKQLAVAKSDGFDAKAFERLARSFDGTYGKGDYNLALSIDGSIEKIVDIEFENVKGQKINSNALISRNMRIQKFNTKLPADARIKITVATPKSLVKVPFALKNVPLP